MQVYFCVVQTKIPSSPQKLEFLNLLFDGATGFCGFGKHFNLKA